MKGDSAQERADRIKARRQAQASEDTFDTRPLVLVPSPTCGQRQGDWVCTSAEHPGTDGHYFAKARDTGSVPHGSADLAEPPSAGRDASTGAVAPFTPPETRADNDTDRQDPAS